MKTLLLLSSLSLSATAQELPRRALFGVRMENITGETARVMKLPAVKGVLITGVVPGSTAEAAGLQRGDVWLTLNGREVNSANEGVAALRPLRGGQTVRYTYLREGREYEKETALKPLPKVTYADFDLEYGALAAGNATLRTLVTRPKQAGKHPAVLFIQDPAVSEAIGKWLKSNS